MKRDPDLIRSLMLLIEHNEGSRLNASEIALDGYSSSQIAFHLNMLADAKFIVGEYSRSSTNKDRIIVVLMIFDLTWSGHEYLDSIRDAKIWQRTKQISKQVGASSFEFLLEIAKGLAHDALKNQFGIS